MDPKGTKKIQMVYEVKPAPTSAEKPTQEEGRRRRKEGKKEVCVEVFSVKPMQHRRLS